MKFSDDVFDDMFDNVFDDDNFDLIDNELAYNALIDIFNERGFDKQLMILVLACLDFVALKNIYNDTTENDFSRSEIYNRMLRAMATISVLIETFVLANDDVFEAAENFREEYINNELKKIELEKSVSSFNRMTKFFRNENGTYGQN